MRLQAIHKFLLCYWFFNLKPYWGKQVAFKQTLDMTTQTTFLRTNLACIFL